MLEPPALHPPIAADAERCSEGSVMPPGAAALLGARPEQHVPEVGGPCSRVRPARRIVRRCIKGKRQVRQQGDRGWLRPCRQYDRGLRVKAGGSVKPEARAAEGDAVDDGGTCPRRDRPVRKSHNLNGAAGAGPRQCGYSGRSRGEEGSLDGPVIVRTQPPVWGKHPGREGWRQHGCYVD